MHWVTGFLNMIEIIYLSFDAGISRHLRRSCFIHRMPRVVPDLAQNTLLPDFRHRFSGVCKRREPGRFLYVCSQFFTAASVIAILTGFEIDSTAELRAKKGPADAMTAQ